jgi:putative Holliday junction resolvase
MTKSKSFLCLDVGAARIGVAVADSEVKLAVPFGFVPVDGEEIKEIARLVLLQGADTLVVGYPRNQSGEPTAQTAYVEAFTEQLKDIVSDIVFQDESLTSVLAEQRLKSQGGRYEKGDIDAEAAAIILQDYMESTYA